MNTAQALVNIDVRNLRPQVSARCGFRSVSMFYWMTHDKVTDYGGSKFLCNTSKQLQDYTTLNDRRPHTSVLLPYCQEYYSVSQVAWRQFRETADRYSSLPWVGIHVSEFNVLQVELCLRPPYWKASAADAWLQNADTCHVYRTPCALHGEVWVK